MPSPIQRAINASRKAHKAIAYVFITVSDGVTTSDSIRATVGFTGDMTYANDMTTHYTKHRAFLVDVADYNIGGSAISPVHGHTIVTLVNGVSTTFEVVDASGTAAANYDDNNRQVWRVNTKEMP